MLDDSTTEEKDLQKQIANGDEVDQVSSFKDRGMYSSVIIENFRLFDRLELDDLGKVNLFFGANNSGKTSILEAIYTHACGFKFMSIKVWLRRRGNTTGMLDMGECLMSVFHDRSSLPCTFTISAKLAGSSAAHKVTSRFHPSSELADLDPQIFGQFSGDFSSEPQVMPQILGDVQIIDQAKSLGRWEIEIDGAKNQINLTFPALSIPRASLFKSCNMHDVLSHRSPNAEMKVFAYLKRYRILDEFAEEMGKAFPGISKIDMIPYPDGTQGPVYVEMKDQWLPLFAFGDGMRRWFFLLGYMLVNQNAVHCIEEIDSTFHPDAHGKLSRLLVQYAEKFNNQLFLTSHSMEFADAFLEALYGEDGTFAGKDEDPVRIFTIKRSEDHKSFNIWKFTGKEAYESRSLYDLELR